MKHLKYFFFLPASIVLLAISCSKSSDSTDLVGNWVTRSQLNGDARFKASSFVIADTAYIATGFNGTDRYKDVWAYRADNNTWSLKATFPGAARNSAVGFTVSGKGYITTGYDGSKRLKDTWEYNASTNTWVSKADFPEPINAGSRHIGTPESRHLRAKLNPRSDRAAHQDRAVATGECSACSASRPLTPTHVADR